MNKKGKGKRKGRGKGKNKNPAMAKYPPWLKLPEEIWGNILKRLSATEILLTAQKVCTTWRRICKDPCMWRVIDLSKCLEYINLDKMHIYEEMCHHVVDRSQGELVNITLAFHGINKLLSYVSERSPKLKRLAILYCFSKLVPEVFVEAVQNLSSSFEDLNLTHIVVTTESIEALGCYCPHLKSFELNDSKRNDEALNIGRYLPALHHLQLIGNNEGLGAILDGCTHIVALVLRKSKILASNKS